MTTTCPSTESPKTAQKWYALYTKPRHEKLVQDILESRNIEVYLPVAKCTHKCEKPFFPRYLFGHLDLEQVPLSSINWMPGMAAVVSFDGQPAAIPDAVVDWLRDSLGHLDSDGFLAGAHFRSGDLLRVTAGPLKGMEAIFDRRLTADGRARVLVQFLGRFAACEVDLASLEQV